MLVDTTLREGAQAVGVRLEVALRVRLARELLAAGVEVVEMGWVGQEGLEAVAEELAGAGFGSCLAVWAPCRAEAVARAAALGVGMVHVGVPASQRHRVQRLGLGLAETAARLEAVVAAARELGLAVRVGLEDASRATPHEVAVLARAAQEAGACGVRLADTCGLWNPAACAQAVAQARTAAALPVGVHCHDDFGMATANALAALDAGAAFADASLLGLGERAGISALEELAGYLTLVRGSAAYDLPRLRRLCHGVAKAAGLPVPRSKAVAGEDVFASESGLHVDGLLKDPGLFEPCPPEALGARRRLLWGGKSGRGAVARLLARHGVATTPAAAEAVLDLVRRADRPLEAREVLALARLAGDRQAPCQAPGPGLHPGP